MMSVPTRSPYVFSKYALRGFSDVLRYEMEGFGVKVSKLPHHILNADSEKRDKCGSMLWRMTQIGNFFNTYSMPQTVWNTENVSKWTSNVQLLCSTASTYWIIYSWLTSNPKISIWAHTWAKIHSFSKCQNSDHFWGCEKSILQIQPDHNETCL